MLTCVGGSGFSKAEVEKNCMQNTKVTDPQSLSHADSYMNTQVGYIFCTYTTLLAKMPVIQAKKYVHAHKHTRQQLLAEHILEQERDVTGQILSLKIC